MWESALSISTFTLPVWVAAGFYGSFHQSIVPTVFEFDWTDVVQRRMHACSVIQLGRKTPIKPSSDKCIISGIRGTASRYMSEGKRDGAEQRFFVACERSSSRRPPWRYRRGCLTPVCAAACDRGVRYG